MARALEITFSRGGKEIVELTDEVVRIDAKGGASYRLIDPANPQATFEAIIRKIGDDLQIDVLGSNADIVLADYFFVCELDYRGCSIELDSIGGAQGETLTPDNLNTTALSDGSVLLWTTPPTASLAGATKAAEADPAATSVADSASLQESGPLPWKMIGAVGGGVLAIGALAGGGGSGEDSAVGSDRSGSGTLASRAVSIDTASSDVAAPVDGDGNPTTGAGVSIAPGTVASGGQTNDTSPQLAGTLDQALTTGQQVLVYRNGVEVGTAAVDGESWTFTDNGVSSGQQAYAVRIADSDGNRSPLSDDYVLQVDGTAPDKPVLDPVTGDNQISAEEEAAGVAVIGRAEAGSVVTAQWGQASEQAITDDDGRFVLQFSAEDLPGPNVESISVIATDSFGNASAGTEQAVEFTSGVGIAITAVVDDREAQTGEFGSGSVINDARPTLIGTLSRPLEAGQSVQVIRNGQFIDTAEVDGRNWSFTDGNLSNGEYSHVVRVVDAGGSILATSTGSFVFDVDVTVPFRPSVESVDRSNFRVDDDSARDGVQVSGEGEVGTTISVTWGEQVRTARVESDGDWALTFEQVPVDNGRSLLRAVSTDDAGNVSRERIVVVRSDVSSEFQLDSASQTVITAADLLETNTADGQLFAQDGQTDTSTVASAYAAEGSGSGSTLLDPLTNQSTTSVI